MVLKTPIDALCYDSHNLGFWYGWSMEQAWLWNSFKNSALVVRWAGFEETHYLDGPCYDSRN